MQRRTAACVSRNEARTRTTPNKRQTTRATRVQDAQPIPKLPLLQRTTSKYTEQHESRENARRRVYLRASRGAGYAHPRSEAFICTSQKRRAARVQATGTGTSQLSETIHRTTPTKAGGRVCSQIISSITTRTWTSSPTLRQTVSEAPSP